MNIHRQIIHKNVCRDTLYDKNVVSILGYRTHDDPTDINLVAACCLIKTALGKK